jgi:hypothetical protein
MLQVLAMGFMVVPEFFVLTVACEIVAGFSGQARISFWLWFAFAGGVLWDLRWAASPGMSGLVNAASVFVIYLIWNRTPIPGRSALFLAVITGALHFVSGCVHYLAWASPGEVAMRMFVIQQLLAIPAIALICMIYAFRRPGANNV